MAHPDAIKVIVEESANVAVTSGPSLGNLSVTPETPAVIEINTNSSQITLAELIGGNPEDGQVIVYDSTTNTFVYDYSTGGGALTSDLQVTNKDSALGDATGRFYEQNDSHEGIIRDLLAPASPVISSASLSWLNVSDGFKVPAGISSTINFAEVEFMFPERVSSQNWSIFIDGTQYGVGFSLPSDYGNTKSCRIPISGGTLPALSHGSIVPIKIQSSYTESGIDKDYVFESTIYAGRGAFLFTHPSDSDPGSITADIMSKIEWYDVPSSEGSDNQSIVLNGSSRTQDSNNYTWIATPSSLAIDSITEVVSGEGVANRTFSFSRVGLEYTYPLPNGAYSVYLYRSNQRGALSSQSSLRIKLNRS